MSTDLLDLHRTALAQRQPGGQRHRRAVPRVGGAGRRRPALGEVGVERRPLVAVGLDVAIQEEPRQRLAGPGLTADVPARVPGRVVGDRHAGVAERLDALVEPVDRLAAVVDRGERAVLVGQHRDGRVDVAGLADPRVDAYRAAGEHLGHRALHHVVRHVEVVDDHVKEDAAADGDVLGRWGGGVAAGDPQDVQVADRTVGHPVAHRLVPRVEAAVEADHERDARLLDGRQRAVHLREVEADRLLAEDRLAGLGRRDDQVDVGVGARADRHRVDVVGGQQLLIDRTGAPVASATPSAAAGTASATAATT